MDTPPEGNQDNSSSLRCKKFGMPTYWAAYPTQARKFLSFGGNHGRQNHPPGVFEVCRSEWKRAGYRESGISYQVARCISPGSASEPAAGKARRGNRTAGSPDRRNSSIGSSGKSGSKNSPGNELSASGGGLVSRSRPQRAAAPQRRVQVPCGHGSELGPHDQPLLTGK